MSVFLRCQCGKENLVEADRSAGGLACIRCGRTLAVEAAKPATFDARGRMVPVAPVEITASHPAAALEPAERSHSPREYLYWALPLALLPLAFALGQPADDTEARFRRTLQESPPSVKHRIEQLERDPFATIDDLFDVLPGNKIIGAFAPRTTQIHWSFAAAAVACFLGLAMATFPHGGTKPAVLLGVGLFTATAGIMLLLMVQPFFTFTVHDVLEDTGNFAISMFGYILGVGLFEELAKLLPVIWRMRRGLMRWRAACLWGLASGAGFGVAEGIFYSEQFYNGISTIDMYVVRFLSCVALHAIWSASAALSLCAHSRTVVDAQDKAVLAFIILRAIAVPAVLHGIYDVALQYHYEIAALVVALISFGWLASQIEATRTACATSTPTESAAEPADLGAAAVR